MLSAKSRNAAKPCNARKGRAAAAVVAAACLAVLSAPASAQFIGGGLPGATRGDDNPIEDRRNRVTVSIRTVPVGSFCLRVVEAVGFDPRLNRRLYRLGIETPPMTSLGAVAYENALASARTQGDALAALPAARRDARPYVRDAAGCGY